MSDLADTIAEIRAWARQRRYAMSQRQRIAAKLGAHIRCELGWSLTLPEAKRAAVAREAARLIRAANAGSEYALRIAASKSAAASFNDIEAQARKKLVALAKTLPVWPAFGASIRGFGALSLALIIGEAGDLSGYASAAKLRKRMGLAVIDGVRQGGLPKSAGAEAWIAHGYNRQRRSLMWNIGAALIKQNDGVYRACYLARKTLEAARDPDIKALKAHRRAQRYMEQRLLRDLWAAWRRVTSEKVQPKIPLSPDLSFIVPAASVDLSFLSERRAT